MKIRCSSCNKRFDYDVYSGVCPKCGEFHRPEKTAPKTAKKEENDQKPQDQKPRNKKLTVILLVLIAAVGAGTFIFNYFNQQLLHTQKIIEEPVQVNLCQMGEPFSYMTENNEYQVTIDTVCVDESPEFDLPQDYEAVKVIYKINRIYLDNGGEDRDRFYEIQLTPYLETKSGYYLTPISKYNLKEMKGLDNYEQLEENKIGEKFEYEEGVFYYLAKKDDIKSLYIVSNDYDMKHFELEGVREIIRVEGLEELKQ